MFLVEGVFAAVAGFFGFIAAADEVASSARLSPPPGISGSAHRYSCLGPALIAGQVSRVQYWCARADCKRAAASKKSTVCRASHSFISSSAASSALSAPSFPSSSFSLFLPSSRVPLGLRAALVTVASETEPRVAPRDRERTAAVAAATPSVEEGWDASPDEVEADAFDDAPPAPAPAVAPASSSPPLKTSASRKGLVVAGRSVAAAPALFWGRRMGERERKKGMVS